ncbi:twin-arginine translocase subunit TatC [Solirubrobacter sp. CPCC 204708]|uniref:Sec-independent protein translocase protein TatC n=1 Tax=Solirubrobacter deserti TaxID=2282478 RepID=A0ABT4RCN4_9ACTN|nr:twin-arginine translocase subunit TatC [Solirubrobacter deserti]MBE2317018.1 twin-arginine translocase subunit TatC [Solirubrobacter deserti]MDA0136090.1 twin-arginine translocase subunit TatC [Solirubrobacter deserti]
MASTLRAVAHDDRLSLVEHLTELRVRIVICLAAFVAATALCMVFNQDVLDVLNKPLTETVDAGNRDPIQQGASYDQDVAKTMQLNAALYRVLLAREDEPPVRKALLDAARENERVAKLAPEISARKPVTLGVSEPFLQTLKVSAYAGLLISLPIILFQIYAFVLPAFSPREKQIALPAMLVVPFLFIGGVVFGYFTVVPRAIEFLQNFNTDAFDVLIQAQPYYRFVLMLLIAMGLLFQIPVAIVAVTRVGIVTTAQLRHNRRYAILAIAVTAMLLPGQDPITMGMMMAPMYVLFEASILFSWLLDRRAGRAAPDDLEDLEDAEPEHVTIDRD